eukprot:gb/GECG01007437.1/.p1 GENE.gb/GECG01007437.1/~~gb/GECG01007437.1/.p1  ORF type:complete len:617 (+),score=90.50 gb/GECG01007437.1/:1-1851(+)
MPPRAHHHMMKRLRKAFSWAETLRSIAHETATPETILEAEGYVSYLYGVIAIEEEAWVDAAGSFAATIKIFETLKPQQNGPALHAFSGFLNEVQANLAFSRREANRQEMKSECNKAIKDEEKRKEDLIATQIGRKAISASESAEKTDEESGVQQRKIESRISVNRIFFGDRWFDVTSPEIRKALQKAQKMDMQLLREQERNTVGQQHSGGLSSGSLSQNEKIYLDTLSAIDDAVRKVQHEKEDIGTAEALTSSLKATKFELMHQNVIGVFGTAWNLVESNLTVKKGLTQPTSRSADKQTTQTRQSIERLLGLCHRAQKTLDEMNSICESYSGGSKAVFSYSSVIHARKASIESISVFCRAIAFAHHAATCISKSLDPNESNNSRKQNVKQAEQNASQAVALFQYTNEQFANAVTAWSNIDVKDPGNAIFGSVSEAEDKELGSEALKYYQTKCGKFELATQYLMSIFQHQTNDGGPVLFPSDACLPFGVRLDTSSTDVSVGKRLQTEGQRTRPISLVQRVAPEVASTFDPFTDVDYLAPSKPHAEPVPSKPLHFDVAYNFLSKPDLSHRQSAPRQTGTQAARPPPAAASSTPAPRSEEDEEAGGSVFSSALSWLTGR